MRASSRASTVNSLVSSVSRTRALGVLQDRRQPRRHIADLPPRLVERIKAVAVDQHLVMALSHS
jgi:hypothetical protein